jgi:drug/metabolite transporter (DMT)-like permease
MALALGTPSIIPSIVLVSIALGACGQLMLKAAARDLPPFKDLGLGGLLGRIFTSPMILAAFLAFFISAVLWIVAIRKTSISTAYPATALSYIIIFIGGSLLFNEVITWRHWTGAGLIVSGIALIVARP